MAIIRKNKSLVGFEQGINVKTKEQLFNQTRARFFPVSRDQIVFSYKSKTHASVIIPISEIPTDPGDGNTNLEIKDYLGNILKIRVSKEIKAFAKITVNSNSSLTNSMSVELVDNTRKCTFTFNTSSSSPSRTSSRNFTVGVQGVSTNQQLATRIFESINLAVIREELNIAVSIEDTVVTVTQNVFGNVGNTPITLNNMGDRISITNQNKFAKGTLGIPRRENGKFLGEDNQILSRAYHPLDSSCFALYTRDSENVKHVTFDINKIINNSGFAIKSKIIQDDVLLIYQNVKGTEGLQFGNSGTKTLSIQNGLNNQSKNYDFKFDVKNVSGQLIGEDIFYDVDIREKVQSPVNRYVEILVGQIQLDNLASRQRGEEDIPEPFTDWFLFSNVDFIGREANVRGVAKFNFTTKIQQSVIDNINFPNVSLPAEIEIRINASNVIELSRRFELSKAVQQGGKKLVYDLDIFSQNDVIRPAISDSALKAARVFEFIDNMRLGLEQLSREFKFLDFKLTEKYNAVVSAGLDRTVTYSLIVTEKDFSLTSAKIKFYNGYSFGPLNENIVSVPYLKFSSGVLGVEQIIPEADKGITLENFSNSPKRNPQLRAIGSLTVLDASSSRWTSSTSFTLSGSTKAVKFTSNPGAATTTRVDSNNYTFGVQGKTGEVPELSEINKKDIIESIANAIRTAAFQQDLDVSLANNNRVQGSTFSSNTDSIYDDSVSLIQMEYGEETNKPILISDTSSLSKSDFIGAFSEDNSKVYFRDASDIMIRKVPNHEVRIRSFGLGSNIDDFSPFQDLSFHEPRSNSKYDSSLSFIGPTRDVFNRNILSGSLYSKTDVSPLFYITSINDQFPFSLKNVNAPPGYEFDGVIEPLPAREEILGLITEKKIIGLKGNLAGTYNYDPVREHSYEITNKLVFENENIIPYFDQNGSLATEIGFDIEAFEGIGAVEIDMAVYSIPRPGIIFNDNRVISPFLDTEERIIQAFPLVGNNPERVGFDSLVSEIFSLNHDDDDNLGVENFRRTSGFVFSSNPHPGTDSIAFGGLRYV